MYRKKLYALVTLMTLLALLLPAMPARAQGGPAIDRAGQPRDHLQVVLQADSAPLPGGSTRLSFDATPLVAVPSLKVEWLLPAGVTLGGPTSDSYGALGANQTVHSERQVSFAAAGVYKVVVMASFSPAPSATFAVAGVLFFTIDPRGSLVSDRDPQARSPMGSLMQTTVTVGPPQPTSPDAPDDDPCFSISGNIVRTERNPGPSGLGAATSVPVANALVDIRESDVLFDDSYGEVLTDSDGDFSKSFCDDDGWFDDTLEIYVRLRAELRSGGTTVVEVEDSSYIDEVYEYDSWEQESDGGSLSFNIGLNEDQSGVFNIAQGFFDAWRFWQEAGGSRGGGGAFDGSVEAHYEPGYGDDGSYYDPFWVEITIADDPSDPDQWDESVIMHEFGHYIDDDYSCDDNPGGDHYINQPVGDSELAWGEGYPDYWQSAVRDAKGYSSPSFYLDINGSGMGGIVVDLETYDVDQPDVLTPYNELAIAAMLWDFKDSADDGQDRVSYGHDLLQFVYTSEEFMDAAYGFWDDTCDFYTYMRGWIDSGQPTDAETAATVFLNTDYNLPASLVLAGPQEMNLAFNPAAVNDSPACDPDVYRWWKELTYVADNSASMTGPKFDAVKALLIEAVNDLGDDPEGTEFTLETFNNTSSANQVQFTGQFFPETLVGPINALAPIGAADPNCDVYALRALSQAIADREQGDAWLLADGDTWQSPSVDNMRQMLNDRQVRASVALMGICPALLEDMTHLTPPTEAELQTLTPEAQQQRMAQWLARGAAQSLLGPAADDVPGGLVPYLLTAINSGGMFLYVDNSQLDNAADILRAQITNSAGAGRWSDYVSDQATYEWDYLATWEYAWQDARLGGTNQGNPPYQGYLNIAMPGFSYYNSSPFTSVNIFEEGYLTLGSHYTWQPNNTTLPNPAGPNNAIYPFWDDLWPYYVICGEGQASPDCGQEGWIYTMQSGDWFVVEFWEYVSSDPSNPSTTLRCC
jgi:hypothetical protein